MAERGIPSRHGSLAVARDRGPREPAQLEGGGDRRRASERPLEHGREQARAAALAAQALREPHRAHGVDEGRQGAPRDREGPRDAAQRPAPRPAGEDPRQVDQRVDEAEGEDRQRDREGAGRGIPQSSRRDLAEHDDVRERRREPHFGQRQEDGARAVGAVEEDAIDDPDHDEPGGECRRGAQRSGSQRHDVTRSGRRVRRSG